MAIRDALTSVDDVLGELDVPDLNELDRTVTYDWGLIGRPSSPPWRHCCRAYSPKPARRHTWPPRLSSWNPPGKPARRTGRRTAVCSRRAPWRQLGSVVLVMMATDCAVVTEDYVAAAETARRMPLDSTLLVLEQATPEWAALHRMPRILVRELLTRRRPSARPRELDQRLRNTSARREE